MKLRTGFKLVLYVSLSLLYFSGAYVWARGMGPEASRLTVSLLHFHSIISLWFLILFGYLWHSHIQKGLKSRKKLKSGISLLLAFAILIASVPGLFYFTDERWRENTAAVHSYLGLALVFPFLLHLLIKKTLSKSPKAHIGSLRP